jgi:hypothetical protein
MKKVVVVVLFVFAVAGFAMAQSYGSGGPTTDVLGAHLNYGRGCPACHTPHGGPYGNGITVAVPGNLTAPNSYLWGQDTTNLSGKTITFGGSTSETLPQITATTADVSGLLMCLSCHDGNYAKGAMMKNTVYETGLPGTYASGSIPTLMGNEASNWQGTSAGYTANHPVGLNAVVGCGGSYNWDCTVGVNGNISMTGAASSKFVQNYGMFVKPSNYNGQPVVVCTTCHNQHQMNVVKVTNGSTSGLPSGNYMTMFFIRAPYNPATSTAGANQTAQFCRQCHGGESNEMNGGTAVTVF